MRRYLPGIARRYLERIEASPMARRLLQGTIWSVIGTSSSRLLSLISSVILARILGVEGFGALGIIQGTIGVFGVLANFGMGVTATKFVGELVRKDPGRAGRITVLSSLVSAAMGLCMTLVLVVAAPWLARHTLAAPDLAGLLRIGSLMLFLTALGGALTGALMGLEAFKSNSHAVVLSAVLSFPIVIAGVYLGGLTGAVWGLVVAQVLHCALLQRALRHHAERAGMPLRTHGCLQELPVVWRFSVPAVFGAMLVIPVNWVCSAILVNQPGGYAQMGIFNAANQWYGALIFIPSVIAGAILPALSEKIGQKDARTSGKVLSYSIRVNLLIAAPLLVIGICVSPLIMAGYGEGFRAHWPTLVVALCTALLVAVQAPIGNAIAALGRMWTGFAMNLAWAVVLLVATVMLVRWGALGLAVSRFVAYLVHATWTVVFAYGVVRASRAGADQGLSHGGRRE